MNIVDFSEGILGLYRTLPDGRQAREVVAERLRDLAGYESPEISRLMLDVAADLHLGKSIDIERLREIGEKRLTDIRISLRDEKEEVHA